MELYIEPLSTFQMISRFSIVLLLYLYYRLDQHNDVFKHVFIIYIIGLYLYIGLADNYMLSTRVNMFFRILEVLLFSMAIFKAKNLFTKNIMISAIVVIAIVPFFKTASNPLFLYQTIFVS